ncbi:hypothetical protein [Kribbella deserti]|uniref:Uncharacterized protein n=1 Tax=Kribbella deserti TaxID=1926257 RepID=A0ABV6QX31_9ACTN
MSTPEYCGVCLDDLLEHEPKSRHNDHGTVHAWCWSGLPRQDWHNRNKLAVTAGGTYRARYAPGGRTARKPAGLVS